MPGVAELEGAADRTLRAAADPDLRLRRGVRLGRGVAEGPELSVEVALAAPQSAHEADALVGAAAAALERHAHEVELVLVPAHPDAEGEAAARQLLQRRDLLREMHRVVEWHQHDRRSEPDPLRPAGDPAQRHERVVNAPV